MPPHLSARRFWLMLGIFVVLFALIAFQLTQLMVIHRPALEAVGNSQHHLKIEIPPLRGQIFDRNGKELATSLKVPSVFAVPRLVGSQRKSDFAKQLAAMLDLKYDFVYERISRDKAFVWLKRQAEWKEAEEIQKLRDPGLGILEEHRRFYPQGDLGAHILGLVNIDNKGLEGVELRLDEHLRGRAGVRITKRDALGREIKAFETKQIPAINGNRVYLTIDRYLQYVTEKSLDQAFRQWKAKGAAAVLMEAKTGKILALANRPTFDPNYFEQSDTESRRNRTVTDMFEPGSIFKIVTATAALNEGKVNAETKINCENGEYHYGSRVLHDVHPYGLLTFPEVIVKSSNIGTVKVALMLQPNVFHQYVEMFGFGKPTGIDMLGEARGFVNPPSRWSKTSAYNIPMGHEVLVTLIQMARAMAVLANGGDLVTPFIVEHIEDEAGVVLQKNLPKVNKTSVRPEIAEMMRGIMVRVVEEGTGKNAKIRNASVGGKTGTAQKVLPNGRGYSHNNYMSSFVGFGPAEAPQFVMAVVLDDPRGKYYGGTVAAPVFREVMEVALMTGGYAPPSATLVLPASDDDVKDFQESPPMPAKA